MSELSQLLYLKHTINKWLVEAYTMKLEEMHGINTVDGVTGYMEGRLRALHQVLEEINKLDSR